MPQILGSFETSLRGGSSPGLERKNKLHKGCCGSLHGHGVKKEKSIRDIVYTGTPASRSCSLAYSVNESLFGANFENSSSEGEERSFANPRGSISPMMSNAFMNAGTGTISSSLVLFFRFNSRQIDFWREVISEGVAVILSMSNCCFYIVLLQISNSC